MSGGKEWTKELIDAWDRELTAAAEHWRNVMMTAMHAHDWELNPNADVWLCKGCQAYVTGEAAAACPARVNGTGRMAHAPCVYCEVKYLSPQTVDFIAPASVKACTCGAENDAHVRICWRCGGEFR